MKCNKKEPNPIDIRIGNRMRELRKRYNITQTQLAESIGVTAQQLQKYESGENRVSASRLWQISSFFAIDPGDLYIYCDNSFTRNHRYIDHKLIADLMKSKEAKKLLFHYSKLSTRQKKYFKSVVESVSSKYL